MIRTEHGCHVVGFPVPMTPSRYDYAREQLSFASENSDPIPRSLMIPRHQRRVRIHSHNATGFARSRLGSGSSRLPWKFRWKLGQKTITIIQVRVPLQEIHRLGSGHKACALQGVRTKEFSDVEGYWQSNSRSSSMYIRRAQESRVESGNNGSEVDNLPVITVSRDHTRDQNC